MPAEPGFEALEAKLLILVELHQEVISFEVIEFNPKAVHAQEGHGDRKGRALVAIDKGVILGKALQEGGGLFYDVSVITALRAGQRGFQRAAIADAWRPAKQNDQARVSGKHFVEGWVERHWESRRSSSG